MFFMKSCHLQSQAVCLNSLYFSLPLKLLKYDMANNCHMKNCANYIGDNSSRRMLFFILQRASYQTLILGLM
jgi:hypothetical protein